MRHIYQPGKDRTQGKKKVVWIWILEGWSHPCWQHPRPGLCRLYNPGVAMALAPGWLRRRGFCRQCIAEVTRGSLLPTGLHVNGALKQTMGTRPRHTDQWQSPQAQRQAWRSSQQGGGRDHAFKCREGFGRRWYNSPSSYPVRYVLGSSMARH